MDNVFQQIKDSVSVKAVIERYHAPPNKSGKVVCPFHHEKTASLSIKEKDRMWKCFGCNAGGDIINFVARLKQIENFEAAKMIAEDFRLQVNFESEFDKSPQGQIRKDIRKWHSHLEETDYFTNRGLSLATQKLFMLGYDPIDKAVVIPYSRQCLYYLKRYQTDIKEDKFRKPKNSIAGEEPIWNMKELRRQDKLPIFVVESPICAMSVFQYGGKSIALGGTGITRLLESLKEQKPLGTLVIALDNDNSGRTTRDELVKQLDELRIKHITYNIAGSCKDPNELCLKDPDQLVRNIRDATIRAEALSLDRGDKIKANKLIRLKFPPRVWLVDNILPLGLNMLVAGSKIGKSWMCLQLCIAISNGQPFLESKCEKFDALYYALEDNYDRMTERLIKMLFKYKANDLDKVPLPKEQITQTVDNALSNFEFKLTLDKIDSGLFKELEKEIKENPKLKLIIIDTFQMIRGVQLKNEQTYSYDSRELTLLRNFANEHKISILLIHHTRKALDENDIFNMTTGSTGLMGIVDNIYLIHKKKRMSKEASTLYATGRDIVNMEILLSRNEEDATWVKLGNPDEEEAIQEKLSYENSIVTKTARELVRNHPSGWRGYIKELMFIADDLFQNPIVKDTDFGREIRRAEHYVRSTYGIQIEGSHKRGGAWYEIGPKKKYTLFNYHNSDNDD